MEYRVKKQIEIVSCYGAPFPSLIGEDIIIAEKDGFAGIVNKANNENVIPFEYDNIFELSVGMFILSRKGKQGLCNVGYYVSSHNYLTNYITRCVYEYIYTLGNDITILVSETGESYYNAATCFLSKNYVFFRSHNGIYIEGHKDGRTHLIEASSDKVLIDSEEDQYQLLGSTNDKVFQPIGIDTWAPIFWSERNRKIFILE